MSGFTPEPLEQVGNRSIKEVQDMLRSGYKRITFTSEGGIFYQISGFEQLDQSHWIKLQMDLKATDAKMYKRDFIAEKDVVYYCNYHTLAELLEEHPFDLSRFEISN